MDTRKKLELRVRLGEEVQTRRLTPAQADAELSKLGLDPFEHTPDPATFDPMQEAYWSVVMTLAWIVWRAPEPVREVWDAYRAETVRWVAHDRTAPCECGSGPRVNRIEYVLENPGQAEVIHLSLMQRQYGGGQCSPDEAGRLLLQELRAGRITAEGRDTSTLTRHSITSQEWRNDMYFREMDHGPSRVRAESRTGGGARYDDVLIERADVVRIWAPDGSQSEIDRLLIGRSDPRRNDSTEAMARRRTGVPGRPSSVDLILPEAQRRLSAGGALPSTLAAFATEMSDWLKSAHPGEPQLKPQSAENALRAMWQARTNRPTKPDPESH